jgi:hypothetical protein
MRAWIPRSLQFFGTETRWLDAENLPDRERNAFFILRVSRGAVNYYRFTEQTFIFTKTNTLQANWSPHPRLRYLEGP